MYKCNTFNGNKDMISSLMPYGMIVGGEPAGGSRKKTAAYVINKNGSVQTTWKYRGPDLESSVIRAKS